MKDFKTYLTESSGLHVFDIDDTLLRTNAKIRVRDHTNRIIRYLTNREFNDYKLRPGEKFDFDEFRSSKKFRQESEPIHPMIKKLNAIHRNITRSGRKSKIIMNTAREDFDDKEDVLAKFRDHGVDIDKMHIHRAGNEPGDDIPAVKKNKVLRRHLDTGDYTHVNMYDDSKTNLHHFLTLQNEYPHIKFNAWHVDENGKTKKYK